MESTDMCPATVNSVTLNVSHILAINE